MTGMVSITVLNVAGWFWLGTTGIARIEIDYIDGIRLIFGHIQKRLGRVEGHFVRLAPYGNAGLDNRGGLQKATWSTGAIRALSTRSTIDFSSEGSTVCLTPARFFLQSTRRDILARRASCGASAACRTQIEFGSWECPLKLLRGRRIGHPLIQPDAQASGEHGNRVVVIIGRHQRLAIVRNRHPSGHGSHEDRALTEANDCWARAVHSPRGVHRLLNCSVPGPAPPKAPSFRSVQGNDVNIVSVIGRGSAVDGIRNRIGAKRRVAHAAGDVERVVARDRIPGQPVVRIGNGNGLLKDRRSPAYVVEKDVLVRVERVKERKRFVKDAVEAACQYRQKVQIRVYRGAYRLPRHPLDRRHIGIVGVGHHHAGVKKLKTGAGSREWIDHLCHVGHGLVRVIDRDGQWRRFVAPGVRGSHGVGRCERWCCRRRQGRRRSGQHTARRIERQSNLAQVAGHTVTGRSSPRG